MASHSSNSTWYWSDQEWQDYHQAGEVWFLKELERRRHLDKEVEMARSDVRRFDLIATHAQDELQATKVAHTETIMELKKCKEELKDTRDQLERFLKSSDRDSLKVFQASQDEDQSKASNNQLKARSSSRKNTSFPRNSKATDQNQSETPLASVPESDTGSEDDGISVHARPEGVD